MVTKTTQGIKVSIEVWYQPQYSNPFQQEFMFAYRVNIQNNNTFSISIQKRHWYLHNGDGTYGEIISETSTRKQPTLKPKEEYEYIGTCNTHTEFSRMDGTYSIENKTTGRVLQINIPVFQMIAPFKNN